MASPSLRRPENVPGDVYVDATCIDCDTCRWMAPSVFARRNGLSAVVRQPADSQERRDAMAALVSCPTASIGTVAKSGDVAEAARGFPVPIAGPVHHCGYHSAASFGATSYLITRPEGNILVDSPRFAAPLVKRLEEMGGVSLMLLTHRDDVADHEAFARHFGLRPVAHERDAPRGMQGTLLAGEDAVELAPGLTAIPTPGHTAGHVVFRLEDAAGTFLFTGDHLAWDEETGHLEAWPDVCWHDWGEQTQSMRRLLDVPFDWVLPGHGRRVHLPWPRMRGELVRLLAWMETQ